MTRKTRKDLKLENVPAVVMLPEEDDAVTEVATTEPAQPPQPTTIREHFLESEVIANELCIAQSDMIRCLLLTILSKEHAILVGPHGCNKTRAINILLTQLGAAGHTFYSTLDKFTPPEVLLGMFSPRALKEEDRWLRNTKNKLPEAEFAFVGEVFRGNSAVRAALHTIMNERYIENDGQRIECPLHSMFCDSNSYPVREEDFPFFDRILFRYHVGYIESTDANGFLAMLQSNGLGALKPRVTKEDVCTAVAEVGEVKILKSILRKVYKIRSQLLSKEVTLSDRRWHKSLKALQANAWLRGSDKVTSQDLVVLKYVLWDDETQRILLEDILAPYAVVEQDEADEGGDDLLAEARKISNHAIADGSLDACGNAIISMSTLMQTSDGDSRTKIAELIASMETAIMTGGIADTDADDIPY